MNAIEKTPFSETWATLARNLEGIRAVLVVSAHWLTRGTRVTAMEQPRTIHDFGGFPPELFAVRYPAPGSPTIAEEIALVLTPTVAVKADYNWGLDHGAWSILVHIFPQASLPVLQLSIDGEIDAMKYLEIGKALRPLREKGILIVASGNIVHNLQLVDWRRLDDIDFAFDWAREADAYTQRLIREKKWDDLTRFDKMPQSMHTAINSAEHFIPLLYTLGAAHDNEEPQFFNTQAVGGALTMTSVRFG
ncbi:MAG: 4,5-DOPA dioxygenase extradiol [Turneriella sp.]|nr:4,5-DOPA dioxygenase extradiol [Turneriella sp.]